MYVETDFFLALIKEDDWLTDSAEAVYERHRDSLWTSEFTLIELMMVAYREGLNAYRVVNHVASMVEVDGQVSRILTAATFVEELELSPFDALHAVASRGDTVVSSDDSFSTVVDWVDLRSYGDPS